MKKALGFTLLAASLAVSCVAFAADKSPIKIGKLAALTGDGATWGEHHRNAAIMAVEEVNAKGGIAGHKVELVVYDTKGRAEDAVNAAHPPAARKQFMEEGAEMDENQDNAGRTADTSTSRSAGEPSGATAAEIRAAAVNESNRISAILSTGITVPPGSGETAGGVRLTAGTTYLPNVFA